MITRKDVILNLQKSDTGLDVKIPNDISIHNFVLCLFILLIFVKVRDPKDFAKLLKLHLGL
jgi:hypothetical protein